MPFLLTGELLGEVGAGHEGLIECAFVHQRFPFRRFAHLLEGVDVVAS
jgi:hypothetical protein